MKGQIILLAAIFQPKEVTVSTGTQKDRQLELPLFALDWQKIQREKSMREGGRND
jgi:hypothetical protein